MNAETPRRQSRDRPDNGYTRATVAPHNLNAERALLGIIIDKNDTLFEVGHLITPGDFFEPYHGELWKLVRDLIEVGREANPSSLMHDMAQDAEIGGIGAYDYLRKLQEEAPPASTAMGLARTVRDLAGKRGLLDVMRGTIEEVTNAPASLSWVEIMGHLEDAVAGMLRTSAEVGIRQIADIGDTVLRRVGEAMKTEKSVGLEVGLACVQDLTGPLLPGKLYIIPGPSGSGKSALAQQIGEFVAGNGHPVLMFEAEMEEEEVAGRTLAAATGITANRIEGGGLAYDEFEKLSEANKARRHLPFYIDASTRMSLASVRGRSMRMQRLKGLSLIIVDHIRYMQKPDPKMGEFEAIQGNLQGLKRLAKDMGVPVIVLGQFKQGERAGPVRPPVIDDCYGGSAIEQEADILLMMWREEYMLRRREPAKNTEKEIADHQAWETRLMQVEGRAEFILGKRRGGKGWGKRSAFFHEELTRFSDMQPKHSGHLDLAPPDTAYDDQRDPGGFNF